MAIILIIDDNTDLREGCAELLELEGFTVITARDGLEGVNLAATKRPHLIISDIDMPKLNGYDVLRTLRQNPSLTHIPFLFFSAKPDLALIQREFRLDARHVLLKPLDVTDLPRHARTLLYRRDGQ